MKKGSLLLHPLETELLPDLETLYATLHRIGFTGDAIDEQSWMVGEQFLQLLTFMGCSPHIRLEPDSEDDHDYCHISLRQAEAPQLLYSNHSRPCRCRSCGKPVVQTWKEFDAGAGIWRCRHCATLHKRLEELRWRNDSGVAVCFVEIHSIYPGEAQPVDSLIKQLEKITSSAWRYFHLHDQVL
ncbi:hypothetical protein [Solemya elarraichensis gill symbiont]|uniref:Uncharacterized protein n=1 Tax=Solemya elarraichensis gill symbiont TaxID=1918949 RepID=A0A1T2L0U8_9GAMM|nr:hypothetical protein [Solemya elarraichensis gill symbiont]OOZ38701.1 hypothetical protein BOW52_08130 [Solemya elarraichensis gill symbiont]